MLRAELPALPNWGAPLPGMTPVARSLAPGAPATYSPLGQQVAQEVQQFIGQGSGLALASPQASWLALQAARQQGLREPDRKTETAGSASRASAGALSLKPEQQAFLQRIQPWAEQAAEALGVSPRSVLAHAALESGWGQRPVRGADGRDSLNLFGIKAGRTWPGASVQALTTEVEDGQVVPQTQSFRQYADLPAVFADYAKLLGRSSRYSAALNTGEDVQAFAAGLARGGYATDPQYAEKLLQVSRSIPSRP